MRIIREGAQDDDHFRRCVNAHSTLEDIDEETFGAKRRLIYHFLPHVMYCGRPSPGGSAVFESTSMKLLWHRRRFIGALLKVSAALAVARSALWGMQASAADAPPSLTVHEVETLRRVCFLLFPYPELGAAPYERLVNGVSSAARSDADLRQMIGNGVARLDAGREFLSLDESTQIDVLAQIEAAPFFAYMLQRTRDDLFNNPVVWAHIGYEGSSLEFGGYVNRGLNDIDWLN
jgi:hypothetical protein